MGIPKQCFATIADITCNLLLNNSDINFLNAVDYLDITFDGCMHFEKHVKYCKMSVIVVIACDTFTGTKYCLLNNVKWNLVNTSLKWVFKNYSLDYYFIYYNKYYTHTVVKLFYDSIFVCFKFLALI